MPCHVLTLSNDHSKRNFGGLVIQLLDERECRRATCLAIHLEDLIGQQLEFDIKSCKMRRKKEKKKKEPGGCSRQILHFYQIFPSSFNIGLH